LDDHRGVPRRVDGVMARRLASKAGAVLLLLGPLCCLHCRTTEEPSDEGSGGTGGAPTPGEGGGAGHAGETGGDAPVLSALGSGLGAGCSTKNDCRRDLSCIRGVCQPTSFALEPTGKECFVTDCAEDEDCCAGAPTEAPEKCRARAAKCLEELPGCTEVSCSRSSDCVGGGSCRGSCSVTAGQCAGNADCLDNLCVDGRCVLDFAACDSDAECDANVCVGGTCDCFNPSYEPADPVCTDPDCEDACQYACEQSRCVLPTDCESSEECFGATPLCDDGTCVECTGSADCSFDRSCISGRCENPCESDGNCAVFEACQAGECLYVGCRSDRECRLLPSVELADLPSGTDPRLLRCHTEDGIGRCIVPCQTDAQCPPTEVCSGGVCEYIGCELDSECKTIVGLHDQESSSDTPWVSTIECRAAD